MVMSSKSAIQKKVHSSIGQGVGALTNPHQAYPVTPLAMFKSLWFNRSLIWQMTKREVTSRYRGSVMGIAWSFFTPILMLFVYTFVFSVVFEARWGVGEESRTYFGLILFVGMIVHGLLAECINRSPGLILSNVNYVKKVVFPLEILPWVAMGSALFNSIVSIFVLLLAQLIIYNFISWTCLLIPLILLPLVFAGMGLAWFLSALGVFMRDIGQVTTIFTTVLLFMSPVFYPLSAIPKEYQVWLQLNPLTLIIEESRKVLIFGSLPDWSTVGIALIVSLVIAATGFWWFQKTRKGFADVL